MAEMYFADKDALKAGMKSPEMAAAGENLDTFAKGLATMSFGEEEMAGVNPPAGSMAPANASAAVSNDVATGLWMKGVERLITPPQWLDFG